jgi:glycosyltransferase involved in cell wall biosynthesis
MDRQNTICLLNDSFPPVIDGVANAVENYAREIEEKHGHAIVATPDVPGADDSGYAFPVIRYPSIDTRPLVGYVAGIPFSSELSARLDQENAALLHSHCPVSSTILARELREMLNIPLVLTYHTKFDIDIENAIRGRLLQEEAVRIIVRNISACDEVWVVSRGAGENLRSLGYEGDLTLMPNGVDVPRGRVGEEEIERVTGAYDLPEGLPVYLFVGRLMWYKGIRIILEALAKLQASGADFRMVFVGSGGDEAEIKALTEKLGLTGNVLFTGAIHDRSEIRAWYCRADLFLFPSTFDTNGLVVREAAACSLPSVLIRRSCAAEGVTDGKDSWLIEENADSLFAKLTELSADRDAMRRAGEKASEDLYLSWADAVSNAYERYETVIDNYRSGRYPRHMSMQDGILAANGALMDVFAQIEEMRRSMNEQLKKPLDRFSGWFDL